MRINRGTKAAAAWARPVGEPGDYLRLQRRAGRQRTDRASVAAQEMTRAGFTVSPDIITRFFTGRRPADMSPTSRRPRTANCRRILPSTLASATLRRLRAELRATAHVEHALTWLRGPKCVASSSALDRIRISLETTGLLRFFEPYLFSASDVPNGKPAPDLFLHVAARCASSRPIASWSRIRRPASPPRTPPAWRRSVSSAAATPTQSRRSSDQRRRPRRDRRHAGAQEHGGRAARLVIDSIKTKLL